MADKLDTFLTICSDALQAEVEVMDRLTGKVEKYVAAIGVILGFHIVELGQFSFSGHAVRTAFSVAAVAGLGLLLVALVLALISMRVRAYPTFPKSCHLQRLMEADVSDDQAKVSAAQAYLDLRDAILAVNEKRASSIRISGAMLAIGFLMSFLGQLGLALKF